MSVIAPTVTAESADEYKTQIERIQPFAQRVHIDISDGVFAPVNLGSDGSLWWPQEWQVDIHAMVAEPIRYVEALAALRPYMIMFHAEAQGDLLRIMQYIKQCGIRAGIAVQRPTVPSDIADLIKEADHVMIFSGDLGHFGGTASLMQLEKIRLIKAINPTVEIGWDGGINVENAFSLSQGGVDVLNVGGSIHRSDTPDAAYATLVEEINKQGVM